MNPHFCNILTVTLLLAPVAARAQGPLPEPAQKVVQYLLADWAKHMHSTSIAQAMDNLGMGADDDLRLVIGEHFRAHPELHFNLRSWGANNYLLSDQEKRIAKFLIATFEKEDRLPDIQSISKQLDLEPAQVKQRLAFLNRTGFLRSSEDQTGYQLTEKYRRWGGPLRFNYHTVTIGQEDPFAVWWAVDFLLVVTSGDRQGDEYRNVSFRLDDSCAHCSRKIRVEVKNGEIKSLDPPTVFVQQGGGWAVDNLFWSEEHLDEWLSDNRAYKRLRHLPMGEFLQWIKERRGN